MDKQTTTPRWDIDDDNDNDYNVNPFQSSTWSLGIRRR